MGQNVDFRKILKKEHERKWVALNPEQTRVIDYAEDLAVLRSRLGDRRDEATYMKVLPTDVTFAF
ncbi:MAG: hypothetical protein KGI41_00220 [Patescibacteria group bacterium]|nr:hypothetical protein [Patescibacteria group bacterium]MDE1965657.1 hypothetical protein [Patescibacteria group bacterium]